MPRRGQTKPGHSPWAGKSPGRKQYQALKGRNNRSPPEQRSRIWNRAGPKIVGKKVRNSCPKTPQPGARGACTFATMRQRGTTSSELRSVRRNVGIRAPALRTSSRGARGDIGQRVSLCTTHAALQRPSWSAGGVTCIMCITQARPFRRKWLRVSELCAVCLQNEKVANMHASLGEPNGGAKSCISSNDQAK